MNTPVEPLDTIVFGGPIYVDGPISDAAVGIAKGRIAAVGPLDEVRALASSKAESIDLDGRMLLPGFNDAHAHPIAGGLERLRCDLTGGRTRDDYTRIIARYAEDNTRSEWISGGGWSLAAFPGGRPTAKDLDAAVADRPVFLYNKDHHGAWVNAKALEMAGIDDSTPDPDDGRIERDDDGHATGMLHEGAMALVERLLPPPTQNDLMEGLLEGQSYLQSFGITGWNDAIVGEEFLGTSTLPVYLDASTSGRLRAKVRGSLWLRRGSTIDALEELIEMRAQARSGGFDAESIKIMQDGVVESFTAGMIDPYLDGSGEPGSNRGLSFFEPEFLNEFAPLADAAGFQLHFHAIGDRAVRECLDAVESARTRNGMNDLRHHIAHIQVVHPDDLPRFAALNVIGNAQPLWACLEPQMRELNVPFLGAERISWQYPFGSLSRSGARLAFGSDWPVSSPNPFAGMHVAVERTEAPSEAEAEVNPEPLVAGEKLDVRTATAAYTLGSAYVSHLEAKSGSIEVGKAADLVVVDRDITQDGVVLDDVSVDLTMIDGDVVFER